LYRSSQRNLRVDQTGFASDGIEYETLQHQMVEKLRHLGQRLVLELEIDLHVESFFDPPGGGALRFRQSLGWCWARLSAANHQTLVILLKSQTIRLQDEMQSAAR